MVVRSLVSFGSVAVVLVLSAAWIGCSDDSDAGNDQRPDASSAKDASSATTDSATSEPKPDAATEEGDFDAGPSVSIDYGSCETFTPCGGDITGTWRVKGGCVGAQALADLKQGACVGVAESDVKINVAGTLSATGTTLTRKTKLGMTAKVAVPKACVDSLLIATCPAVEAGLSTPGVLSDPAPFDKATCVEDGAGGCDCMVARGVTENDTSEYTVEGNAITTTDPDRTFDYCVSGDTLTYRETTGNEGFSFPMIVELEKE